MTIRGGTVCPLCAGTTAAVVTMGRDRSFGNPGIFAIRQCGHCQVMYLTPRLSADAVSAYYHAAGDTTQYCLAPGWTRWLQSTQFKRRMRHINREISAFVSGGTLLDVGCGRGEFLFGMTEYKQWRLRGLEMNTNLAQFVTEVFHIPVLTGWLEQVLPASVMYDVITLWDVFEHLRDPGDALGRLKGSLNRDGLLLIKMPNPASLGAWLFGACWSGWGVPQHYFTWLPNTFEAFVRKHGLKVVRAKYLYGAYSDLVTSVGFAMHGVVREQVQKCITRVLSRPPFIVGLSPIVILELALGRPSSVAYFLRHAE